MTSDEQRRKQLTREYHAYMARVYEQLGVPVDYTTWLERRLEDAVNTLREERLARSGRKTK